jgi:cyanate permease
VLVPSALIWIVRPAPLAPDAQAASAESWTRGMALRSLSVWSVSGAFAIGLMVQVGFVVHQIALLEPLTGRANAGLAVMLTTTMAILGRLTLGSFVDRFDARLVSSFSFASQAAALLIMATTNDTGVLLACCAVFGFSVGNLITLPPLILQREFNVASFGMLVGLTTSIVTLAAAFGPGLIGLVRDLTGSYTTGLYLSAILDIVAAGVVLIRVRRIRFKARSIP